ncbi:MAG: alpha/beta hydrolase [Zavarzinella sp.]
MKIGGTLLRFCLVAGLVVAALTPCTAQDLKSKIEKDIVYAKVKDTELKLDYLAPAVANDAAPLVVCVHGGGWRAGNKKDLHALMEVLAKQGFAAVSVQYRLSLVAQFPAQIEDVKTAVRFMRKNAKQYKINPENVGAVGFSAGGHLVALMGVADDAAKLEGSLYPEFSSRVQCVVDYFGPTDFELYSGDASAQKAYMTPLFGGTYQEKTKEHQKASPIKYISKDDPPFLIFHGDKDWIVPIEHTHKFAKMLKDVNVPVQVVVMDGEGHGWNGKKLQSSVDQTISFFKKHLKK